jgi:glutamate dehydrogenase (NAD(P)+)
MEALYRFVRSIRPFILERYSAGPDLNVKMKELDDISTRLDIPSVKVAIAKAQGLDLPDFMERYAMLGSRVNHVTLGKIRSGSGLAAACSGVLEFLRIPQEEATVAIQGFGGLGSAAAYCLHGSGVRIVGLADEDKSLISKNEHSLNVEALVEDSPNGLIPRVNGNGRYGGRGKIYDVQCDVFVPAAVENAVVLNDAKTIAVKAIVPGANLAITQEAEKVLYNRGIIAIPDFVAGSGGSLSMDGLFGPETHPSPQEVLDLAGKRMRGIVKKILELSRQDHITPREAALRLCSQASIYPDAKPYGRLEA